MSIDWVVLTVDGFVQVYSPGCPHCRALVSARCHTKYCFDLALCKAAHRSVRLVCQAPTYSALARAVSAIPNLVVAKMDGTS